MKKELFTKTRKRFEKKPHSTSKTDTNQWNSFHFSADNWLESGCWSCPAVSWPKLWDTRFHSWVDPCKWLLLCRLPNFCLSCRKSKNRKIYVCLDSSNSTTENKTRSTQENICYHFWISFSIARTSNSGTAELSKVWPVWEKSNNNNRTASKYTGVQKSRKGKKPIPVCTGNKSTTAKNVKMTRVKSCWQDTSTLSKKSFFFLFFFKCRVIVRSSPVKGGR